MKILYEDHDILAIDKPSGVLTHPAPEQARYGAGPDQKTILGIFRKKYPKIELVHRLDKETSGVMLLAKNQKAHEFLKKQFANREVKKVYHAIVSGSVKNDHGIINKPIGRSPSDFRRRLSGRGARGAMREAITEYEVLERFTAKACENFSSCALPVTKKKTGGTLGDKNSHKPLPFTYLEIKPKTGRTHQIRVHMKFLNHPVVGDSLYNPKGLPLPRVWVPSQTRPLRRGGSKGGGRMMLHAKSIEFNLPAQARNLKGKIIKVESPLPKEFTQISI